MCFQPITIKNRIKDICPHSLLLMKNENITLEKYNEIIVSPSLSPQVLNPKIYERKSKSFTNSRCFPNRSDILLTLIFTYLTRSSLLV